MRAIIVRDLDEARVAFGAAAELGVPLAVISAPGAALYQGVGYFAALIEAARAEFPTVAATAILDCGDAPGLALAAFRHGVAAVRVEAPPKARARIADIAAQSGAALVTGRLATLDLAGRREPHEACLAWLAKPKARRKG